MHHNRRLPSRWYHVRQRYFVPCTPVYENADPSSELDLPLGPYGWEMGITAHQMLYLTRPWQATVTHASSDAYYEEVCAHGWGRSADPDWAVGAWTALRRYFHRATGVNLLQHATPFARVLMSYRAVHRCSYATLDQVVSIDTSPSMHFRNVYYRLHCGGNVNTTQ